MKVVFLNASWLRDRGEHFSLRGTLSNTHWGRTSRRRDNELIQRDLTVSRAILADLRSSVSHRSRQRPRLFSTSKLGRDAWFALGPTQPDIALRTNAEPNPRPRRPFLIFPLVH